MHCFFSGTIQLLLPNSKPLTKTRLRVIFHISLCNSLSGVGMAFHEVFVLRFMFQACSKRSRVSVRAEDVAD